MGMSDDQTINVYDAQIDSYTDLVDQKEPDTHLLAFISRIAPDGLVLDLGCGPAADSSIMRDRGLRVDPVDASAEMVRHANETYAINARQATFADINEEQHYDGIWASFSLLHASAEELPGLLAALHRALKPAGIFHLAMKTGNGARRDKLGRYYSYYSEQQLQQYLTDAGFTIDATVHGEAMGLAGDVEPWIILTSVRA